MKWLWILLVCSVLVGCADFLDGYGKWERETAATMNPQYRELLKQQEQQKGAKSCDKSHKSGC